MTILNLQSSPLEPDQEPTDTETAKAVIVKGFTKPDARSTATTDGTKNCMHFSEWWSEYQEKMKSAFQGGSLKLQMQP